MNTTVVNIRRAPLGPDLVYIGRVGARDPTPPTSSSGAASPPWPARGCYGNPWQVDFAKVKALPAKDAAAYLASVIAAYRGYFERRVVLDSRFRDGVLALRGKRLGCFCKRADGTGICHGDVIVEWLAAQPVGRTA